MLISTLLAGFLRVAAQETAPDPFMVLFSVTCMKHYSTPDLLRTDMKKSGSAELTGDAAKYFLANKPGIGWTVPIEAQPYIVALRDDGICTVFAQKGKIVEIRKDFLRLVSTARPPLEARSVPGGPSGGPVQTIAFAWARPADKEELVFTLTTSSNQAAPVQAMASVALTQKP